MRRTLLLSTALVACAIEYACYANPFGGLGSSGGGGGGGSSSGSSTTDCTPSSTSCSSGQTLSTCVVYDGNGTCSSAYFTVGPQTYACASCEDTTSCVQASTQACTGSSSGGGSGGTATCTPGTCSCINSGPYACGNTCYSTAAAALQACVFNYGIDSCTECGAGGSGSGSSSSGGSSFAADCLAYYTDYGAGAACVACLQNHSCPADTGLPACESSCPGPADASRCDCIESCLGENAAAVDQYYSCVTAPCGGSCP